MSGREAVPSNPRDYDLVARLRSETFGGGALELDAADEIERLTAELALERNARPSEYRDHYKAERDRLRAALERIVLRAKGPIWQDCACSDIARAALAGNNLATSQQVAGAAGDRDQLKATVEELRTVSAGLRASLDKIGKEPCSECHSTFARAALAGDADETKAGPHDPPDGCLDCLKAERSAVNGPA